MAALLVARRKKTKPSTNCNYQVQDRDAQLLAVLQCEELESDLKGPGRRTLSPADGPVTISSDVLMGKMPNPEKILRSGVLWRLTSHYEWKPMETAITSAGIFFSRPGEDSLRDLIPLFEVVDVKKRLDAPGDGKDAGTSNLLNKSSISASVRNLKISGLLDGEPETILNVIQIRTMENGYNSGRTYYLKADSMEMCNDWLQVMRSASSRAVLLKKAGPSRFRRLKYRVRHFYHHFAVQSFVALLIFASFIVNIAQTEMVGTDGSAAFTAFELFFTAAFTVELLINMLAHFFRPFFRVLHCFTLCHDDISFGWVENRIDQRPCPYGALVAASLLFASAALRLKTNFTGMISRLMLL